MTPPMVAIYDAVADLLEACLKDLKRTNRIDTSELSLEDGLFRSLDDIIRRQLDAVWHTVTPKTKQVRRWQPPTLRQGSNVLCWASQCSVVLCLLTLPINAQQTPGYCTQACHVMAGAEV